MKRLVTFITCLVISMSITTTAESKADKVSALPITIEASEVIIESKPQYQSVTYYDIPLDHEYQDYIRKECESANVNMELVLAVMQVESSFDSSEVSQTNDYGIMQINECNHTYLKERLGIVDFLDPYNSAKAGIYMLSKLNWCENESQMLMCYNMGTTGAKRYWNDGIYESNYSRKVLQAKEEIGGKRYEVKILCD